MIQSGGGDEKFPPVHPYSGPNYQGYVFVLNSSSGKSTHVLAISTQWDEIFLQQAYITGLWYGEGDPSNAKSVEGLITGNGDGISCSWTTPNGYNVLQGALTYNVGKFGPPMIWPTAYLDGDVTAYDAMGNVQQGKGPGHVSGPGRKQLLVHP